MLQTQLRTLLEERGDLLIQLQDQNREITVLRRSLGFGGSEEIDMKKATSATGCFPLSSDDLKPLLMERDSLKMKVKDLENELKRLTPVARREISESVSEEKTPEKNT